MDAVRIEGKQLIYRADCVSAERWVTDFGKVELEGRSSDVADESADHAFY